MSADDYIFVDTQNFEVWHCTASCVCEHKEHCHKCQKRRLIGKGKTYKQAIKIAEKEARELGKEGLNEYGIYEGVLWCK